MVKREDYERAPLNRAPTTVGEQLARAARALPFGDTLAVIQVADGEAAALRYLVDQVLGDARPRWLPPRPGAVAWKREDAREPQSGADRRGETDVGAPDAGDDRAGPFAHGGNGDGGDREAV